MDQPFMMVMQNDIWQHFMADFFFSFFDKHISWQILITIKIIA